LREGTAHQLEVRVYYEDTDAGGIVYHASYLRFAERGRTEFLRSLGLEHGELKRRTSGVFAVRRCAVSFDRPAQLDDLLVVRTSVRRAGGARLVLDQKIARGTETLTRLEVELAFIGPELRPMRLPRALLGGHLAAT
jgi:acyl-CoA thioester hydrolase